MKKIDECYSIRLHCESICQEEKSWQRLLYQKKYRSKIVPYSPWCPNRLDDADTTRAICEFVTFLWDIAYHNYEFRSSQRLFFVRFFLSNFDILVKRFSAFSALTSSASNWRLKKQRQSGGRTHQLRDTWGFCTPRVSTLCRASSRLYRSRAYIRWETLAEIYTMHSFAPFSWDPSGRRNIRK